MLDEVWYRCPDCNGEGTVELPDFENSIDLDDPDMVDAQCGECGGSGRIEGDVNDVDLAKSLGWVRVDP